jgi:CheY-like chemotaxis protein
VRILVIDDYVNYEIALRDILEGHTVAGARDPDMLLRVLAGEGPFDQAIVDLRFMGSASTGLTALARLRERSPATRAIVASTEEENRLLYLLAAFQFFAPKALLAKNADALATRAIVTAVGRGEPAPNADADPYRDAAAMRPSLLDRVVRDQAELGIWQELARFDRREDIAKAAHVHPRTLDKFTASKCAVIEIVNARFPYLHRAPGPRAAAAHGANLIEVIHFARTHTQFFADREVAGLLRAHWRSR